MNPFRTLFAVLCSHKTRRAARFTPRVELLEDRLTPAVQTWTGAAGLAWTDGGNWASGQKPNSGDDLIFPDNALNKTNFNDFINGKNFGSIKFTGDGGYTLTGNRIELLRNDVVLNSSFGTNYINLPINLGSGVTGGFPTIRVTTNGTLVINGVLDGNVTQFVLKDGGGDLILNAANTYAGDMNIDDGKVIIQNGAALGRNTRPADGDLELRNNITVPDDIFFIDGNSNLINGSGNNTLTGKFQVVTNTRIQVNSNSRLTISGVMQDPSNGDGGIFSFGFGDLVLSGTNTYTDDNFFQSGQVIIQNDKALGAGSGETTLALNAVLSASGVRNIAEELTINNAELRALNNSDVTWTGLIHVDGTARFRAIGSGKLKITQELTLTGVDNVEVSGGPIEFAGGIELPTTSAVDLSIGGGDTLNVSGGLRGVGRLVIDDNSASAGTILLAGPGAYTHTGIIEIAGATLEANATLASQILVSGGTLRGGGGANNLVATSGTVDPGADRDGRFDIANDLTLGSASTLHIDLLNSDQLRVTGAVNLQNAILNVTQGLFGPTPPNSLRIIDNLGNDPVTGQFASLGEGATFAINGQNFTITYQGGTGNDVVITRNTGAMAPGIAITASIQEGQVAHLTGHLVDPNPGDRLTLVVNWGDGSKPQTFHPGLQDFDIEHRYRDDGQYIVQTSWFDQHGGGNHRDLTVSVANVAPVLTDVDVRIVGNNQVFVSGRIVDPGRDAFTLVIQWGNGQSSTYEFAAGTDDFKVSHRYQSKGNYRVNLSLSDGDGGTDQESLRVRLGERNAWLLALAEFLDDLPGKRDRDDLPWQWM